MTFLMKAAHRERGRGSVLSAERLIVSFTRRYRPKRDLGFATEVEEAGVDKASLDLIAHEARNGRGEAAPEVWSHRTCEASAPALKRVVRRLRPREAAELAALDSRLEALWAEVDSLQSERDEALRRAFSKGHVVTVAELREMAEAFEAKRGRQ